MIWYNSCERHLNIINETKLAFTFFFSALVTPFVLSLDLPTLDPVTLKAELSFRGLVLEELKFALFFFPILMEL